LSRALEARGLPTVNLSTVWDITSAIKPPRACFLDFPIGCPAGRPHAAEQQREILTAALNQAPKFGDEWRLHELPFQWSADGSRDWEEELRDLYRRGLGTVQAHVADHTARGESLIGRENEISLRCNC
jgi:hypothetical protein